MMRRTGAWARLFFLGVITGGARRTRGVVSSIVDIDEAGERAAALYRGDLLGHMDLAASVQTVTEDVVLRLTTNRDAYRAGTGSFTSRDQFLARKLDDERLRHTLVARCCEVGLVDKEFCPHLLEDCLDVYEGQSVFLCPESKL